MRGSVSIILMLVGGIILASGLAGFFYIPALSVGTEIIGDILITDAPPRVSLGETFTVHIKFALYHKRPGEYHFYPTPKSKWRGGVDYEATVSWTYATIEVTPKEGVSGFVKLGIRAYMIGNPRYYLCDANHVVVSVGGEEQHPPVANFSYEINGLTVKFTDKSTDEDNDIKTWQWIFGDRQSSNARNPTHIYEEAGSYTVLLKVQDANGNQDYKSKTIEVSAPPSGAVEEEKPIMMRVLTFLHENALLLTLFGILMLGVGIVAREKPRRER